MNTITYGDNVENDITSCCFRSIIIIEAEAEKIDCLDAEKMERLNCLWIFNKEGDYERCVL